MSDEHTHAHFVASDADGHDAEESTNSMAFCKSSSMTMTPTMTGSFSMGRHARKGKLCQGGFPPHPGLTIDESNELEQALGNLFKAYDMDESGELTRDEFMKIEMRMAFERGEMFKPEVGANAKFSLMDRDRSGTLDFLEFRERQLLLYQSSCLSKEEIIEQILDHTKGILLERVKMGPRFHAGIRQAVRRIFHLYDTSGDGSLSPTEWIAAQKVIALEIMDDLDETWVDEATFTSMDSNGDGRLDIDEYMEASFSMFEVVKLRCDHLCQILQRVCQTLQKNRFNVARETQTLDILVQNVKKPQFRPPHSAWQDEPTEADFTPGEFNWQSGGTVRLPLGLQTVEEIASILRLLLQLPVDTWLSIFCAGREAKPEAVAGLPSRRGRNNPVSPASLLRGERAGTGNVQSSLEWLAKPNAVHRLYVKNLRKRPQKLVRQSVTFFEEREELLAKQTGQILGIDWETQLVGHGRDLPNEVHLVVGDSLLIEVPQTDGQAEFRFVSSIYMDGIANLSRPLQVSISADGNSSKKGAKKPKKAKDDTLADRQDIHEQLTFVALSAGRCLMFVDVSWEDQEEKLATKHRTCAPVNENSIGRIGPIEVVIERQSNIRSGRSAPKKTAGDQAGILWWNGDKWTNKKGAVTKGSKGHK